MHEVRLFRYSFENAEELSSSLMDAERNLQILIEKHLETFFGIKFLAHEYGTGMHHRGQIDTLGIDDNFCPVIIEFKKRYNENIITQGLYYLDWLLDHKAEFTELAAAKLGAELAEKIEFSWPRVLCVASEFSRFDERAITRIDQAIELVRYRLYGNDLIMLEKLVSSVSPFFRENHQEEQGGEASALVGMPVSLQAKVKSMSSELELVYLDILNFVESLGEDVSIRFLKHYIAMSRLKNFASLMPAKNFIKLWLNLDPGEILPEEGFSRDVRNVGHYATGNLEIDLYSQADLEKAKPLIELSYNRN